MSDQHKPSQQKPVKHRTLQIHVTRKCNLKCLHCYSMSGPEETEMLPIAALKELVNDAAELGYSFVTLSGGEPFLYPHMRELLAHAKGLGLKTGAVTNGMFLDQRRLDQLKAVLDLIVVSLDGAPERHNRMRANPAAFSTMARKLPALKKSGIPFGFLFTLSRDNAHELDWAADFAVENGAALLQVHPLDNETGRAAETGAFEGLDPDETAAVMAGRRAFDAQERLEGKLRIIVDFQPRLPQSETCQIPSCGEARFADMVSSLCIETDGAIVPMGHGFSRDFVLGYVGQSALSDMAEGWIKSGQAATYAALVEDVRRKAQSETAPVVQNMAQTLRRASYASARLAAE